MSAPSALRYDLSMCCTIFTAIDLWMGVFLLDMMSTNVPPEKTATSPRSPQSRTRTAAISIVVLLAQIARRYGWIGHQLRAEWWD